MNTNMEIDSIYRLTPVQEGMLFHSLYTPESGLYGCQFVCDLDGELNEQQFVDAWRHVMTIHSVLRTLIWSRGERIVQVVRKHATLPAETYDWRGLAEAERVRRMEELLAADLKQGYALAKAPLMRLHVIRLEQARSRFVWSFHHLLLDGWSLAIVLKDVFTSYESLAEGEERPALRAPRPYRDYVAWLERQDLEEAKAYWQAQLHGFTEPTPLISDMPAGPADAGSAYAEREARLPAQATAALLEAASRCGVTLNTIIQGAWALLLSRYSGSEDVVYGSVVSGRSGDLAGLESMVGLFINTLPMRAGVDDRMRVDEWLIDLQRSMAEMRQYEHSSLVQIQGWSDIPRGVALFESVLVFENYPIDQTMSQSKEGITVRNVTSYTWTNYAFSLMIVPEREVRFRALYDTRRFSPSLVDRMLEHLMTLLAGIAVDPCCRIGELPMLTPGELTELERWNATAAPYERTACIHQLFERQVARAPQAEAIRCGETRISYGALNLRANQLAHYIRAAGIEAGARVGICLPRTPELVVAALAVLKAGAAYVPLDPSHPAERLGDVLTDAGASLVLTDERRAERLAVGLAAAADRVEQPVRLLCIDREAEAIAAAPSSDPVCAADPDAAERLAYIIYTSGSTGKPKGVMVQHRPVINLITWANTSFGMSERDRVLWVTSLGFDLSVYDLFGVLAAGGSICIADEQEVRDPERLLTLLEREEITFWDSAPAALQQLAPLLEEQAEPSRGRLRLVFLSGDWIPVDLPGRVRRRYPGAEIVGLGGATEATVWSNVYRIGEVPAEWTSIPYGKPIANAVYRVLDRSLGRCPVGVPGELYIGGEVLALGYVDAQLTAERFIADPYGEPGARLYRTGDLARYRPDGNLEFLGRLDHQVKLRGYRVETGEIESVLKRHPAVREAVVVVHGEGEARRLAGYVVPNIGRVDERVGSASTIGQETIQQEAVSEWEQVFDETYRRPSPSTRLDRRFNIAGWTSSYTDQMLPESDMLEWTEQTVARIKALSPKRVLEIGCGTGLLLSRIAPSCELYWGFDISREALDYVQTLLREERMDHVQLFCSPADTLREVEAESFDTIIVNSVVQYFPDVAYLLHVMEEAIRVLKPGGALFIGDVRNYALLKPFHLSVEMYRGADDLQMERLLQQVNKRMDMERELLVDPGLFERLAYRYAGRLQIVCQAKESLSPNELTKFRYDVTIRKTSSADSGPPCQPWLAWDSESELAEVVAREWRRRSGGIVGVRGVPSGALVSEWHAEQLLHSGTWPPTLAQFRSKVRQLTELAPGWTTTRLRALGDQLDADTYILLAEQPYVWDVLYVPRGWQDLREALRSRGVASGLEQQWGVYVNHPSLSRISRRLLPELRTLLRQALPEPMVPSVLMALYELPVSSNGKVDRKALPLPERQSTSRHGAQAAPRDLLEMRLIKLWEELLGVQPIGVQDSFFDLGGHSLLAVRLMTQIEEAFGIKLPMSALFEHATIERLAAALGDSSSLDGYGGALVPIRRGDYDAALFMIHPTGGNVLCYASLAGHLADGYDIYALQSPALAGDFRYSDSVEAMASHYIDCMRSVQPHGPYRVAGWSFGGTVAYEIARRLERSGDRVELLALIDCPAPSYTKRMPQMSNTEFLLSFCREAERFFGRSLAISGEELQRLEPDEQLAYIWDVMQESAMISPGTSSAQFGRLLEVFRKHLHALRSYDPMPDYAGPLTLYRAALPSEAEWGDASTDEDDGVRGWSAYVSQSVQAFTIPGDHVAMMTEPHVQRLAEQLDRQIRELSPGLKIGMS